MGSYNIELAATAEKELKKIEGRKTRARIVAKIESLAENPRPAGSIKIAGSEACYRLRQGDYRILYEIREAVRVVAVVHIGHRREAYRRL